MKNIIILSVALCAATTIVSCGGHGGKTDIVPSGSYKGSAEKVNPEEHEIYVRTPDKKLLELYLTDSTTISKSGATVPFDSVKTGAELEVKVEKVRNKLNPLSVNILK